MQKAPETSGPTPSAEEQRRTERILVRLPILVQGTRADGKAFTEKTHTVVINRYGAQIILQSAVRPSARVTITNLQNALSCPFRLVGLTGASVDKKPEWGIECLAGDTNIWGIAFPEKGPSPPRYEVIDVLLECSKCHSREFAELTLQQYQTALTHNLLSRECRTCQKLTGWWFGYVEGEPKAETQAPATPAPPSAPGSASPAAPAPDQAPALAPTSAARVQQRRRNKRLAIKMPVRIRLEGVGRVENLSADGICFSCNLALEVGECVSLAVGYIPGRENKERIGRIIWRRDLGGVKHYLYGAHLEDST